MVGQFSDVVAFGRFILRVLIDKVYFHSYLGVFLKLLDGSIGCNSGEIRSLLVLREA
ncbi:hypothetical protein AXFE_09810 [Acidithrix ferrooxidans]|uniref:Uncharacterized protein n=1 Tax=Acidithrix ferrooxidans TaxID=1280514 RepID=A0A0D8HJC8_9ACTN|nr:hypothetical protein AXFE_09810 [Acidithrix ferrooxidans]CAG4930129.1 unnamed protein product [Acidithrix sp. C25]